MVVVPAALPVQRVHAVLPYLETAAGLHFAEVLPPFWGPLLLALPHPFALAVDHLAAVLQQRGRLIDSHRRLPCRSLAVFRCHVGLQVALCLPGVLAALVPAFVRPLLAVFPRHVRLQGALCLRRELAALVPAFVRPLRIWLCVFQPSPDCRLVRI